MPLIYAVEDDENIRQLVKTTLEAFDYEVAAFETATEGMQAMEKQMPDLLLFDIMLPDMDGITAVKQLRQNPRCAALPIMMLTAKTTEMDKVIGLDAGADDYLTKPFGVMELKARVQALLRRSGYGREKSSPTIFCKGDLLLNCDTREVFRGGKPVSITCKEFELLKLLMEHTDRVLTRTELLKLVWDMDAQLETRTLDVHIRTLRQKLGDDADHPRYIKTVRGIGYRFEEE